MKRTIAAFAAVLAGGVFAGAAAAGGWTSNVPFTNQVASSPVAGGGYPVPDGATAPSPGTCGAAQLNSNHSESWIAVQPGTENLVGSSKFFVDRYSTWYDFYLGSYRILNGKPAGNNQVQGYECTTVGTQQMPPSWMNTTDPNADFDTQGRVYQTVLPFNPFWVNLRPNGAIDVSYSDDLGQHWVKGNGGADLELSPPESSLSFGRFEDKQWIAVNHIVGNVNADHVYAAWSVFNGFTTKINIAVSRDRGQTFSKAATLTAPQATGPSNTYVYPSIDAAGTLYVAFASFPPCCTTPATIYVTRSTDDGVTFGPFVKVASAAVNPDGFFANTRFRDGIVESFTASPTYPGHLYVTWEEWEGNQEDVKFAQSTDGGLTWSAPATVNDNVDAAGVPTDQLQPEVAAGPGGAVAVAFYDRRQACPTNDRAILPADAGRANLCIDVSLQAYKDGGAGAVPVGGNVRITKASWDPEQPGQTVGGLPQYPCSGHSNPCQPGGGFIGDYFGLAVSAGNVYALFVSTHFPSSVHADDGSLVYYQQQVLGTVARSSLGI